MLAKLEVLVEDNGKTVVKINVDSAKGRDEFIAGTLAMVMQTLFALETDYSIPVKESLRLMGKRLKVSEYIERMIIR